MVRCNGCRVLHQPCDRECVIRPCLEWIPSPEAQAHATQFLSDFFGRQHLIHLISAVSSDHQRPAVFKSLLYEVAARMINPVDGAAGLLYTGRWHHCEEAVQVVLSGHTPAPPEMMMMVIPNQNNGEEPKLLNLFK